MGRAFSSGDAKRVLAVHGENLNKSHYINGLSEGYKAEVKDSVDGYITTKAMQTLASISVDELNRDKQGIRVKLLHDNGYNTIADLANVPVLQLEMINGISFDGAQTIRKAVDEMIELVDKTAEDDRKVIVFSFFLDTIAKVTALPGDRCVSPINGSVSPQRRQEIIDGFDKAESGKVLPAQIQSGGTGLNIQSASVIILCEPQFKPSVENQAISRAYRMGQTRNVLVYRLLCEDTVDEKILKILGSKQNIFDAFADKSVADENSTETVEIDDTGFANIMDEEAKRITAEQEKSNE